MLTADLVRGRVKGADLVVKPLTGAESARATELLTDMRDLLKSSIGETRHEIDEALGAIPHEAREAKLVLGLRKLVDDRCVFDTDEALDAPELRREVFAAAAEARRAGSFDRAAVLGAIAEARGLTIEAVEAGLYGDLRAAARLVSVEPFDPTTLARGFDVLQAQAVLLRATRLVVTLRRPSADAARALFRRLKFLRLLAVIEPSEEGYQLTIDGPFSLFESVTKYGLSLALLVPVLEELPSYEILAEIRWGKDRRPLRFAFAGGTGKLSGGPEARLLPEVEALKTAFDALKSSWSCRLAEDILTVPGFGVCVPDLIFHRKTDKQPVYLEVMGYWSRDAVWKRVELVEAGLAEPVLFAVSERLRVSAEVLPGDAQGRLYVYKGALSPRRVLEHVEGLGALATQKRAAKPEKPKRAKAASAKAAKATKTRATKNKQADLSTRRVRYISSISGSSPRASRRARTASPNARASTPGGASIRTRTLFPSACSVIAPPASSPAPMTRCEVPRRLSPDSANFVTIRERISSRFALERAAGNEAAAAFGLA